MKGSRNITVAAIILGYYVAQCYVSLLQARYFPQLRYWHAALLYWLLFGVLLGNRRFIVTQCISLFAFGGVMGILRYGKATPQTALLALSQPGIPLYMLLFVILPVMFFSLAFEPFELVKDLPAVTGGKTPAYLLLLLSSGEMFKARFAEILEHLSVRGLDLNKPHLRIRYAHIYLPPLLLASIQEAAYRHSYTAMLGCGTDRLPARGRVRRISVTQKAVIGSLGALAILRAAL